MSTPERDRVRAALLARIADPRWDRTPLQLPAVSSTGALPTSIPGSGPVRTDAERRFERVAIPATVLAGLSLLLCVVVGIAMIIGWSGALPLTLLIIFAGGFIGFGAQGVRAGALARRDARSMPAMVWRSSQPWLGPLAAGPERRLVTVACEAVGRIIGSAAWGSTALDDHRLTLDLTAELDQIDAQAYAVALARHTSTGSGSAGVGGVASVAPGGPGSPDQWMALVDHVAALEGYATAVAGTAAVAGVGAGAGAVTGVAAGTAAVTGAGGSAAPELEQARDRQQATDQQLAAGAVRDEFATAHLQQLTAELDRRAGL